MTGSVALEEAGHAVVALALNTPVTLATTMPRGFVEAGPFPDRLTAAAVALAGPLARGGGVPWGQLKCRSGLRELLSPEDLRLLGLAIDIDTLGGERELDDALLLAEAALKTHQGAVLRIAAALERRITLNRVELGRLFYG